MEPHLVIKALMVVLVPLVFVLILREQRRPATGQKTRPDDAPVTSAGNQAGDRTDDQPTRDGSTSAQGT